VTEPEGDPTPGWWLTIRASAGVGRLIGVVVIAEAMVDVGRWFLEWLFGLE